MVLSQLGRRLLTLLVAVLALPAVAQDATTPERVVEGYGAWEVRCERTDPTNMSSILACEMVQATTMQGQAQPISQIAIGRPTADADLTAVIQLPLGLWLPAGAVLDLGDAGGTYAITILRCLPSGCLGELPLTDAMRTTLSDESLTGSALQFEMQVGTPARIPVVHQGFGAAIASLEARLAVE